MEVSTERIRTSKDFILRLKSEKNLANWFWKKRVEGQCLSEFHPAESVHHLSSIGFVSFTQWRLLHYLYHYTKSAPCIHMHKKLKKESWRQKVVTQVSGIGNHYTNNDHIVHDPLACKTGTLFLCFFKVSKKWSTSCCKSHVPPPLHGHRRLPKTVPVLQAWYFYYILWRITYGN